MINKAEEQGLITPGKTVLVSQDLQSYPIKLTFLATN